MVSKPTAEQWKQFEQRLGALYNPAYANCDGYLVLCTLERVERTQLGITVYVDGWLRGKWLLSNEDGEYPEQGRRFYQERSKSVHPEKQRRKLEKIFGKREAKRRFSLDKKITWRVPYWRSARSLRTHLIKQNQSIQLLSPEDYASQMAARRQQTEE